jgi:outer membrane protein OmpA-like peptidoglycan-associated protein
MLLRRSALSLMLMAAAVAAAAAAQGTGTMRVFVGCPILRNTDLPCWLGESGGELYYLGPQGDLTADFYPPQFRHRMLVEGVVSDKPRICGGIVLDPVRVSVLPELDINCNVILPAAAYADPPHHRGPGPSGVRGAAPEPPPYRAEPVQFEPPYKPQTFTATFDVDSERLWLSTQAVIQAAVRYANTAGASRIEIAGFRTAIQLSNGQSYVEDQAIARARAQAVAQAVRTLGVPATAKIDVTWQRKAIAVDDMDANLRARRVSILVVP